jgi:hypothetical protein
MKEYRTTTELDKLYDCKDYEIKIELDSKGVSTVCDTPISSVTSNSLFALHNTNGRLYGDIILSDGEHELRESFNMSASSFMELNCILVNILDERNGWKRIFNAFASTKLAPMRCNKNATKEAYNISMIEFLLDMDVECFYLESEIRDYYSLGVELVDTYEIDIPMDLQEYIDYDAYAHDWNMSNTIEPVGIMTRFGYLYYSEHGSKF